MLINLLIIASRCALEYFLPHVLHSIIVVFQTEYSQKAFRWSGNNKEVHNWILLTIGRSICHLLFPSSCFSFTGVLSTYFSILSRRFLCRESMKIKSHYFALFLYIMSFHDDDRRRRRDVVGVSLYRDQWNFPYCSHVCRVWCVFRKPIACRWFCRLIKPEIYSGFCPPAPLWGLIKISPLW